MRSEICTQSEFKLRSNVVEISSNECNMSLICVPRPCLFSSCARFFVMPGVGGGGGGRVSRVVWGYAQPEILKSRGLEMLFSAFST